MTMYTKYFHYTHPPFPLSNSSGSHFPNTDPSQLHAVSLLKKQKKCISPSPLRAANTHVADGRLMLDHSQSTSHGLVLPSNHQIPSSFLAGVGFHASLPLLRSLA